MKDKKKTLPPSIVTNEYKKKEKIILKKVMPKLNM